MGVGETISLAIVVTGLLGAFAMLVEGYKSRMQVKARELDLRIALAGASSAQPQEEDRIERRLRVLERIATDKTTTLAAQIEDLREPAN